MHLRDLATHCARGLPAHFRKSEQVICPSGTAHRAARNLPRHAGGSGIRPLHDANGDRDVAAAPGWIKCLEHDEVRAEISALGYVNGLHPGNAAAVTHVSGIGLREVWEYAGTADGDPAMQRWLRDAQNDGPGGATVRIGRISVVEL